MFSSSISFRLKQVRFSYMPWMKILNSIEPYHWQQQLFLWHEESFFGSFLEKKPHNEHEGIEIDSYSLLTLLGHERFSSLAQWDWREPGDAMLAVAPVMLEAIKSGQMAA